MDMNVDSHRYHCAVGGLKNNRRMVENETIVFFDDNSSINLRIGTLITNSFRVAEPNR
jgi:hypothetical protein